MGQPRLDNPETPTPPMESAVWAKPFSWVRELLSREWQPTPPTVKLSKKKKVKTKHARLGKLTVMSWWTNLEMKFLDKSLTNMVVASMLTNFFPSLSPMVPTPHQPNNPEVLPKPKLLKEEVLVILTVFLVTPVPILHSHRERELPHPAKRTTLVPNTEPFPNKLL